LLFENQQQKSLCREVEWKTSTGSSGLSPAVSDTFFKGENSLAHHCIVSLCKMTFWLVKVKQKVILAN